jgi:nucleotide-binding universal stress UspA family protein
MKVLFATDGSENAVQAAKFLARLPHNKKLQIEVVSVFEPPEIHGSPDVVTWMAEHSKAVEQACQKNCDKVAEMFKGANVELTTRVVNGGAKSALVNIAKEDDVDLIVLGAQGHSMISRMLLGSVSDYVATHAHCSVLVVRPDEEELEKKSAFRICAAYDDSKSARVAVEQLREFEWKNAVHVDIVNVLIPTYEFMHELYIDIDPMKRSANEKLQALAEALGDCMGDIETHILESNHTASALVDFAEESSADMIVVGHMSQGRLSEILLGSVSKYVLRHAPCSVWISRQKS